MPLIISFAYNYNHKKCVDDAYAVSASLLASRRIFLARVYVK